MIPENISQSGFTKTIPSFSGRVKGVWGRKNLMNANFESVNLCDLALACSMYNSLTSFNVSLGDLKEKTDDSIDLTKLCHCTHVVEWLNKWGCRHLSKKSHDIASSAILDWYNQEGMKLFPIGKALWELDNQEMATVITAYGSLKDRAGACPIRGGKKLQIDIGPTAASKILFAVRPEALMPWDEAMRNEFGCDGSKESYSKFLMVINKLACRIGELCKANDFDISELPHKMDRDGSTVLELINEYVWVTVTRKCKLPSAQNLALWAQWGLSSEKKT